MQPQTYDNITRELEILPSGARGINDMFAGLSTFILPGTGY
jgi:hypothetical protein